MKAWELIKALEEGKRLIKDYKIAHPENAKELELGEKVSKFYLNKIAKKFIERCHGMDMPLYGSFFLEDVFKNPEHYQIEGQEQEVINEYCKCKM